MPCTILKSDWLCHHVLIVLGANHVMCFLTSVTSLGLYSDYIVLQCTSLSSDYVPHLHSDYIVKRSQVKSCFAASCLHLAFKFSALGFLTVFVLNFFVFFFQFVFEIKLQSNQI